MRKTLSWITVTLWMMLIFVLSSQPAVQSEELSIGISKANIEAIKRIEPEAKFSIEKYDDMLRDNAHFFIYLMLGILVINALKRNGISGYSCVLFALIICILYAASDEIHQFFVPGRSAQVKDVLIDSIGASAGVLVYFLPSKIAKMKKVFS